MWELWDRMGLAQLVIEVDELCRCAGEGEIVSGRYGRR